MTTISIDSTRLRARRNQLPYRHLVFVLLIDAGDHDAEPVNTSTQVDHRVAYGWKCSTRPQKISNRRLRPGQASPQNSWVWCAGACEHLEKRHAADKMRTAAVKAVSRRRMIITCPRSTWSWSRRYCGSAARRCAAMLLLRGPSSFAFLGFGLLCCFPRACSLSFSCYFTCALASPRLSRVMPSVSSSRHVCGRSLVFIDVR